MGATTEWSKWEGMSYDPVRNVVYVALTAVDSGMLTETGSRARVSGSDDVRLPENRCGCVYTLTLDRSYDATAFAGLVCGDPVNGNITALGNPPTTGCNVDAIASPDNVAVIAGQDAILIAEDTDWHENAFMWSYNLKTGELTRLLTSPYGAEITGNTDFVIGGWRYLWANIQHTYEGQDAKLAEPGNSGIGGFVGYLGPYKADKAHFNKALGLSHVNWPNTNAERHGILASQRAVYGVANHIGYTVLAESNNTMGPNGAVAGLHTGMGGMPLYEFSNPSNTSIKDQKSDKLAISNNPDFSSYHAICDKRFGMVQYEASVPSVLDVFTIKQTGTGKLSTIDGETVTSDAWGGLMNLCAGSVTPYGTRLGGEEADPNARRLEGAKTSAEIAAADRNMIQQQRYYGAYLTSNDTLAQELNKPYRYGFAYEAKVQYDGSVSLLKHYTLGRVSFELAYVMPDGVTVYNADDGVNVGFYKFVADQPHDLSSGTLYAAKVTQLDAKDGGRFDMEWVEMAHARAEELLKMPETLLFSDIFETAAPTNGSCPEGFRGINTLSYSCECIKLKDGQEKAATFFETRRYAGYLGATTEFSKWEGMTFDPVRRQLYAAISVVREGMEDYANRGAAEPKFDVCGPNHIRLPFNRCGCVYSLDVDGDYSAYNFNSLVCGTPDSSIAGNTCAANGISEPDNISFLSGHDQLLIGEDSNTHQNDVAWIYDMETKSLTRIFTSPFGSETTSGYWYPNFGGYAYLAMVVQHPYGESDADKVNSPLSTGPEGLTGLIGPLSPATQPGADPHTQCSGQVFAVAAKIEIRGTTAAAWHERVSLFLQYKAERVMGGYSGATWAQDVVSILAHESDGDDLTVTLWLSAAVHDVSAAQDLEAVINDPEYILTELTQSAAMLLDKADAHVLTTSVTRTSRKAAVDPASLPRFLGEQVQGGPSGNNGNNGNNGNGPKGGKSM